MRKVISAREIPFGSPVVIRTRFGSSASGLKSMFGAATSGTLPGRIEWVDAFSMTVG